MKQENLNFLKEFICESLTNDNKTINLLRKNLKFFKKNKTKDDCV